MGKSFFNRAMTYVVAFFTLVAVSSCVNSDYELSEENMDMNVTLFQEGVSLPLGSIKMDLETLYSELDEETREMLRELDGAYMFNMSDNVDMTSDIQDALSGIGDIEAISFDESFSFSLSSVDLSSLEIQGQTIAPEIIDLSAKLEVPDINGYLPKITETMDPIAVSVPRLESDCLDVNFSQGDSSSESPVASLKLYDYELATLKALAESEEGDVEYTYEELKERLSSLDIPVRESFSMEPLEVGVPVEISLPKEIKEVKSIRLKEGAAFEMIVQVSWL